MIQRIQSLYLVSAGLLLVLFLALYDQWGPLLDAVQPWLDSVTVTLAVATALVALVGVGLYKNRALQARVVAAALWLDLGTVAAALTGFFLALQGGGPVPVGASLAVVAPLVAYVLLRMARRGVQRDIETVRSMDRIR